MQYCLVMSFIIADFLIILYLGMLLVCLALQYSGQSGVSSGECCLCDLSTPEERSGAIVLVPWPSPCSLWVVSGAGLDLPVRSKLLSEMTKRTQSGVRVACCQGDIMVCWLCPNTVLCWKRFRCSFDFQMAFDNRKEILMYGTKIEFWLWVTVKYD